MISDREANGVPYTRSKPCAPADTLAMTVITHIIARNRLLFMHISGPLWKARNDALIMRGLKLYVSLTGKETRS